MTAAFCRDHSTTSNGSNYRRVVFSIVISVVLLTIFLTWDSWILVSRSNSSVIPNNFYGAELASDSDSFAPQKVEHVVKLDHDEESEVASAGPANGSDLSASEEGEDVEKVDHDEESSEQKVSAGPANGSDLSASEEGEDVEKVDHDEESPELKVSAELTEIVQNQNSSSESSDESDCDLYHGQWYYDSEGPLYTNNTCPILSQPQNCQGNGRPDKEYENWRWKPSQCELPRFNATKFLELMSGKTITFVGDSVARNQMESLMCLLWQVEVPRSHGNRHMQRWTFKSKSVTIIRFWSAWLVNHTTEPFSYVPEGIIKIHLDVPDDIFMDHALKSDVVVFSNGHWFPKRSVYLVNNEIVGSQLWVPPENQTLNITTTDAYQISTETTLTALATHSNYSGLTILTSYSPDHYENGAWNTGGSCTGKVGPLLPGQVVEHEYTNIMHDKQTKGFYQASKKVTNQSKLKLMDITEAFKYRHDGHPGPFRSLDPNKLTKRSSNGHPPPQDCLHWCMPGPVDTWNELMLELIRREFEGNQNSPM